MRVTRQAIVTHLEKVSCGGQISEAIFSKAFETRALTPDQLLCVVAPSLPKIEPLEEEIGIADLPLLIKCFGTLQGIGNDKTTVDIRIDNLRLLIDEEIRGVISFMVANPSTIGTSIEEKTVKGLLGQKGENSAPITKSLIDGIKSTFPLLKAKEVELHVGPEGGEIVVGNEHAHMARFPQPELSDGKEEYILLFGEEFVDVLGVITNFSEARIHLAGPDSMVHIVDGSYTFILSPRQRGADSDG